MEEALDQVPGEAVRSAAIDRWLNIGVAAALTAILALAAWFGWTVFSDRENAKKADASYRVVSALKSQIRKNPNDATLRVRLGEALGSAGKYTEAVEQLNAALKIEPKHEGAYLDLGVIAVLTEHPAEARRYFQKVIDITGTSEYANVSDRREQAFYEMGRLDLIDKRYDDAVGNFKEALRIRNDASDTYYFLAEAYRGLDDPDAALRNLEIAVTFDPGFAQAHYLMGEIYLAKKDDINASYSFYQAAKYAPEAEPPQQALEQFGPATDWLNKAKKKQATGDLAGAIHDVLVARNLDPKSVDAAKLHAALLEASGKLKDALDVYRQALKLAPKDAAIQAKIAELTKRLPKKSK
jgi:tetratricopeptide (TPR) repeat protein